MKKEGRILEGRKQLQKFWTRTCAKVLIRDGGSVVGDVVSSRAVLDKVTAAIFP
jgi:hypothetical protein